MKKHNTILTGGLALLTLIGAVKVAQTACSLTAIALAYWGGWDIAEASQAAPGIVAALAGGLALFVWGLREDSDTPDKEPEHRRDP